jgi:competence protein ComEA
MAEDFEDFSVDKSFSSQFTQNKLGLLVIGVFFLGIFLLALGVGLFFFNNQDKSDIQIISGESEVEVEGIFVHVDGAVVNPGLYELTSDSRVDDVIRAAGGLSEEADTSRINLAAKVNDGQKVFIPKIGEGQQDGLGQSLGVSSGIVNVNTASESELDTLPGIGPVTAKKIIASRPYSSLEELTIKKAVGASTFEKIKDLVTY